MSHIASGSARTQPILQFFLKIQISIIGPSWKTGPNFHWGTYGDPNSTIFAKNRFNQHADYKFSKETWSNQSVGQKMSRKIDFQKVKLRDICEIPYSCEH